jgi:hypothetical protein
MLDWPILMRFADPALTAISRAHRCHPTLVFKILPHLFGVRDGLRTLIEPTARVEIAIA